MESGTEIRRRAQRSDAGTVRLTERDLVVFRWLTDMKAMYEADLRVLLGRLSGRMPSESAVRQVVLRWQKAGYARAQKLLVGQPRIVWLLGPGATVVGETTWRETSAHTSIHQAEVSRFRLWLEARENPSGPVVEWESERRFRQQAAEKWKDGTKGMHVPDAVVTFQDGTKAAIEVERSEKQRSRLTDIVERLTTAYSLTIYAVPAGETDEERRRMDAVRRQVRSAYEEVQEAKKTLRTMKLVILDYPAQVA